MTDEGRFREALVSLFRSASLEASGEQVDRMWAHWQLVERWNAKINLTRIGKVEDVVRRHYGESVVCAERIDRSAQSVVDVGSGAGFPGVVVWIRRPELAVTLVEADQRKAAFLKEVARAVAGGCYGSKVRVVSSRADAVAERFDWMVSRAVARRDVAPLVGRIADRFAVLVSRADRQAWEGEEGLEFEGSMGMPWSAEHWVVWGAARGVSRGT